MESSKQAEIILKKVLSSDPNNNFSNHSNKVGRYLVISRYNEPRWIVPANSLLGKQVLSQWHPYGFISQIAWTFLRIAYSIGMGAIMPGTKVLTVDSAKGLMLPEANTDVAPVIYVGTPGENQKAVAILVNIRSGQPIAVMKVALKPGACASLKCEAKTLELLAKQEVEGIPRILAVDDNNMRTWQTVVPGCLTSRKLTKNHIDWLLKLPSSGHSTTLDIQNKSLTELVARAEGNLSPKQLFVIKGGIQQIKGGEDIPMVLVHGDFAPWNIKQQTNSKLAVIDWEDSDFKSLPLWDLCHFHFIQAHLFNDHMPLDIFLSNQLIDKYLQRININEKNKSALVLLYLLYMVLKRNGNNNKEFMDFLIEQIAIVRV